jgi:hypothetical protein
MKQLMRTNFDHFQRILQAVVTCNWQLLDARGGQWRRSFDPAWTSLAMPEYVRQSEALLRATGDLIEASKLRDLETASLAFISLTTSCVSCHRYLGTCADRNDAPLTHIAWFLATWALAAHV